MSHHVKKTLLLLLRLVLEHSRLNAVHNLLSDLVGIINLFQEACMLSDPRNAFYTQSQILDQITKNP